MDISKFFDEIDHELMIKAVEHVIGEKWVKMYVERGLRMPVQKQDGTLQPRAGKGTPQGGVISPLLANVYLYFTLDVWLTKHYPQVNLVRYADDIVVHCTSKTEAEKVLEAIKQRLAEVKLQIKEEKTRIASCSDYRRKTRHEVVKFEFLGFSYQPRARKSSRDSKHFTAFAAEISQSNQKRIREVIREVKLWRNTQGEIPEIAKLLNAKLLNAKLRGWIAYYGKYSIRNTLMMIDGRLPRTVL